MEPPLRLFLRPQILTSDEAMAIQPLHPQSGIYLTLKVLQFVKQLRRRLKPDRQSAEYVSILSTHVCASLDMDKPIRLERKRSHPRSGSHESKAIFAANRVCKAQSKQKPKPFLKLQTQGNDQFSLQSLPLTQVQNTLKTIDTKINVCGSPLSAVAGDDHIFVDQKTEVSFEKCSLEEVAQLLIVVHDAINVLQTCRAQFDLEWLIAQGQDAGIDFDAAFLANYEHLLMKLQSQLITTLSRKALELLLLGDYDKKQHRLLSWFTEFSDKPRPLSTSLDIKPSLAVLWGVCWMFYNNNHTNNPRVPREAVLQHVNLAGWRAPDSTEYVNFGLELIGSLPQPDTLQHGNSVDLGDANLRLRNAETWLPTNLESGVLQIRQDASRVMGGRSDRQGLAGLGTYYPQFPATLSVDSSNLSNLLPDIQGNATTLTVFPQHLDHNFDNAWQQFPHTSLPQRTARHLTNSIPSVRVTGSADSEGYAAPHPDFASIDNISPSATHSPQASYLNDHTNYSQFVNFQHDMGNVQPPETSSLPAFPPHRHERTPSINSNSNIPTPISMAGSHSPLLSPASDHRRYSIASSQGPIRQQSEEASSQDGDDVGSPRRNHAYKRAEEPPRNSEGKMVCKHSECAGQIFDRKCEWSKHMDKHDRPYKCNVKGCEKLQGFTYSGGLLRHEREVHKMHGGTKKSLFCPFVDCKRSSGSGFTRKENLAEHIRRVHRRTSMSADLGHLIIPREHRRDSSPAADVRLPSESQYQRILEEDDQQRALKRKRLSEVSIVETNDETDLRSEVKRLRRENEAKDERLRQLEAAVAALQQRR